MIFNIVIEPRALADIQEAIDYYESKQSGLGEYFYQVIDEHWIHYRKTLFLKLDIRIIEVFPLKNFHLLSFILLMRK